MDGLIGKSILFTSNVKIKDGLKEPTWAIVEGSYLGLDGYERYVVTKLLVRDKETDILYHILPTDIEMIDRPN